MIEKRDVKPFLKWAGGKTQLIANIEKVLPHKIVRTDFTYIEPFVGSGAVLFWILKKYPNIKKAVINDINKDLIDTYKTISKTPKEIISILEILQNDYYSLGDNQEEKKRYYYEKRDLFNKRNSTITDQSALFIFLNKTCFNGLYRVNRKNEFNVPIGSYKKPTICDKENILAVSEYLKRVEILCGDFERTLNHADSKTLFYFDPPYKPLSNTSNFNAYTKEEFDDSEQIRLRDFCNRLNKLKHSWILSNSDVKGNNEEENFFDKLYSFYNINRVEAKRYINSNPKGRGGITELLITNQENNEIYA